MPGVARVGDKDNDPKPIPINTKIQGSKDVLVNGIPCHTVSHKDTKGHTQQKGSKSVLVNGQALARLGDTDSNGNAIINASVNVLCG